MFKNSIKKATIFLVFSILSTICFSQNFDEIIKTVASDRSISDQLGYSVSISGDYAIVGASAEDEDTAGANTLSAAGSAYIFEKDGSGNWIEQQKIVASDRASNNYFGWYVSISGDYAIVGAYGGALDSANSNPLSNAGSAYIFERDGSGVWSEQQKIVASDRAADDLFGYSVSISGNYAIVGAFAEDEDSTGANTIPAAGSAYIFVRDGSGVWREQQKITASDRATIDNFGVSVAISGDYVIVGASQEDEDPAGINTLSQAGSAYIFERDGSGIWIEQQKIVASDRGSADVFGISVSISGTYAIVGAYLEDDDTAGINTLSNAGSAYIFERDGSGIWNEQQKIVSSDRGGGDFFGYSVSISGEHAIVGAYPESEDLAGANTLATSGSAYIYARDGSGIWSEQQKIVASDRAADDLFGYSVSISGSYAIVGAIGEAEDNAGINTLSHAGSAYIFGPKPCVPTSSSYSVVANECSGYTLPSGDSTYTVVGTHTVNDTINNAGGCDSVMTIAITIKTLDQNVAATNAVLCATNTGTTITAGTSPGVDYYLRNNANDSVLVGPIAGTDSTLSFNTGTLTSSATYNVLAKKGNIDYAIDLPSSDDYVRFASPFHAYTDEITIEAWVNFNNSEHPWASQGTPGVDDPTKNVWLWHAGIFYVNDDVSGWKSLSFPSLPVGWTHVSTVANASGLKIYYNGLEVASNASGITSTIRNNSLSYIHLGNDLRIPANNTQTGFDNFRVWNTARTPAEVLSNYNSCLTGSETGLVQYTKFDEGSDTIISSIVGSDGVLKNASTNWIAGAGICVFCEQEMTQTATVTVLGVKTGSVSQAICQGESFNINGTIYDANKLTGTEVFKGIGIAGCDSTVTVNLTVTTIDASTTISGYDITATATGVEYKWLDCSDNAPISGATSQSYTAISNGAYAVEITKDGCLDTSACESIMTIGVLENFVGTDFTVYPNPTKDNVVLATEDSDLTNLSYGIYDLRGQLLENRRISNSNMIVDLTHLPQSIYFLKVLEGNREVRIFKIVKQ